MSMAPGKGLFFIAVLACLCVAAIIYYAGDVVFYDGPEASVYGPESGDDPEQLVVMLHPSGSTGLDMLTLAPFFARILPDAVFIAVDAPLPWKDTADLYEWFERDDTAPEIMQAQIGAAALMVERFIRHYALIYRIEYGIPADKVALLGYSQGATMALYVAPRLPFRVGAVVAISGLMIEDQDLSSFRFKKMPVHLIHGEADTIVSVSAHFQAEKTLEQAGFKISGWVIKGGGHLIKPVSIMEAARFLSGIWADAR